MDVVWCGFVFIHVSSCKPCSVCGCEDLQSITHGVSHHGFWLWKLLMVTLGTISSTYFPIISLTLIILQCDITLRGSLEQFIQVVKFITLKHYIKNSEKFYAFTTLPLVLLHSKLCFACCYFTVMFNLYCVKWCMFRVGHLKAVYTIICWKSKVSLSVTSQPVWSQSWSDMHLKCDVKTWSLQVTNTENGLLDSEAGDSFVICIFIVSGFVNEGEQVDVIKNF